MDKLIGIIRLVATLLPLVAQLVDAAEAALPAAGQGAQKLAMVRSALESALAIGGQVGVAFESVWPTLQGIIGAIVAARNAAGAFATTPK